MMNNVISQVMKYIPSQGTLSQEVNKFYKSLSSIDT